ncbi:MAG: protease complex subunit PrcB family protein [Verrucomicrobia bacterium]|nr:protease complex subunit PrcB family protein [Verrucomicrobiota bacterium]
MKNGFVWSLAMLISACSGWLSARAVEPLELRTIAKGGVNGITEARQVVVTNAVEWAKLWMAHRGRARDEAKSPAIDFAKEMVVFVAMGQQRTGGYSVEIVKVEPGETSLKIFVKRKSPPKGAMVTQALTSPFHIVAVPRSELTPEFLDAVEMIKK